jgi:hypothetical protein
VKNVKDAKIAVFGCAVDTTSTETKVRGFLARRSTRLMLNLHLLLLLVLLLLRAYV